MCKSHGSVEKIDRAGEWRCGDKRRAGKEAEIEMPEWARACHISNRQHEACA